MGQKRRITPQLIAAEPPAGAQQDPSIFQPALASAPAQQGQRQPLSLKEQSEYAAKHLGPGRRIYVELGPDTYEVNWHKVLSATLLGIPLAPLMPWKQHCCLHARVVRGQLCIACSC